MDTKAIILLVEDNIAILEANRRILSKAGYKIHAAKTLTEARNALREAPPDAIVLDILLPDGNGLDFIAEIRKMTTAPVLLLTSLTEKEERLEGLRAGGDDYITKPYDMEELRERVAAFLRRDAMLRRTEPSVTLGSLELNVVSSKAFLDDKDLLLTQKEFALLLLLVQNESAVMQANTIYEKVWNQPMLEDTNAIKIAVSRLRKKLEKTEFCIKNLRGEGYRFERKF